MCTDQLATWPQYSKAAVITQKRVMILLLSDVLMYKLFVEKTDKIVYVAE